MKSSQSIKIGDSQLGMGFPRKPGCTTSFKKNLNFMVVYSCVGGWVGLGEGQDQKSANFKSCEVLEVVLKAKFQDGEFQKGFGIRKWGKQFKNPKTRKLT